MRTSFCIFSAFLQTSDYSDLQVIINQLSQFLANVSSYDRGLCNVLLTDLHLAIYDLQNTAHTQMSQSAKANSFNLNIAYFKIEFLIHRFSLPTKKINTSDFNLLITAHNNLGLLIDRLYERSQVSK